MGLMDFIKDAGEKLTEMGKEAELADRIEQRISGLGVKVKSLEVGVDGETVVLKGFPASEEDHEKALLIAGNVRGIAKVSDQMSIKMEHGKPEKAGLSKTRFHTVKSGDTLSGISKKFYGDANKYMRIFEANKPMLADPDRIYPGQVLRIPE